MKANANVMTLPGWDKASPLELHAGDQHSKIFGATGLPMVAQQNDARAGCFWSLPHSMGPLEGNMAADQGARLVEGRLAVDFVGSVKRYEAHQPAGPHGRGVAGGGGHGGRRGEALRGGGAAGVGRPYFRASINSANRWNR